MHVVLVTPKIHWNSGNAGRTCKAVSATLHVIEPLGFSLDDRVFASALGTYSPNLAALMRAPSSPAQYGGA